MLKLPQYNYSTHEFINLLETKVRELQEKVRTFTKQELIGPAGPSGPTSSPSTNQGSFPPFFPCVQLETIYNQVLAYYVDLELKAFNEKQIRGLITDETDNFRLIQEGLVTSILALKETL